MLALRAPSAPDVSPILDDGAPTASGGIDNAAKLYNTLGLCLNLIPPRMLYINRWGINGTDAKPIVASWYLTVNKTKKNGNTFIFDLIDCERSLIVGLDVRRSSKTDNVSIPPIISLKRPTNSIVKDFYTYISNDDDQNPRL